MFSNIADGWADFEFFNFTSRVSYLCDPIFLIGEMLLNNKEQTRKFVDEVAQIAEDKQTKIKAKTKHLKILRIKILLMMKL